jgi:hypothetical protein
MKNLAALHPLKTFLFITLLSTTFSGLAHARCPVAPSAPVRQRHESWRSYDKRYQHYMHAYEKYVVEFQRAQSRGICHDLMWDTWDSQDTPDTPDSDIN